MVEKVYRCGSGRRMAGLPSIPTDYRLQHTSNTRFEVGRAEGMIVSLFFGGGGLPRVSCPAERLSLYS